MGKNFTPSKFAVVLFMAFSASAIFASHTVSITITLDQQVDVVCPGESTGKISVSVTGGTGNLTYLWTGPDSFSSTAQDLTGLAEGTYTLKVSDSSSPTPQTTTVQYKILQSDTIDPIVTPPANVENSTDAGKCTSSSVTLGSPITSDNCSVESITHNAPSVFPIGETLVTWLITDASGNTATATQTVTIVDNEKPTITGPGNLTVNTNSENCTATGISLGDPVISDNCGSPSVNNNAPEIFDLGETIIIWTVTDDAGNSDTATQTVIVEDNEAPVITAPSEITDVADIGNCTASGVNLGTPTTKDNCTGATVKNNAPATFPIGTTQVIWTLTDASGNIATSTQTVTINDTEKPVITAPADVVESSTAGSCSATGITLGTASATDNCTGVEVSNDAPSSYSLGTTTVTWSAIDAAGNISTAVQTVTIKDTQVPIIQAPTNIEVSNIPGTCNANVTITAPSVTDNCGVGAPEGIRSDAKALNAIYPVGTTTITWNIIDDNGNEAIPVTQTVTVLDTEPPVKPALEDITWGCEFTLDVPSTTDNCSGTINGTTTDEITYSVPGTYVITWTFTDSHNNSTTVDQTLIIDPISAVANISPVQCNGFSTGAVTVAGSGGVAPYTYTWATLGNGATKNNLAAGTYSVTVSDINGCEMAPLEVVITEPVSFIEITEVPYTVGCFGQNSATATAEVTGGSGNYSYLWSDGQDTRTAVGLAEGQHTVTVTDENGCTATKSVTIEAAQELIIPSLSTTETTSFGSATGMATVNISGGTAPYEFSWSNGQTGQIARNLKAGSYSVTVTDANGCSATNSVTIIDSIEGTIVPSSLCLTEEGGIRVSTFKPENVRGGTGPYTYSWNFGEGATPATGTGFGPHTVNYSIIGDKTITMTITDANGLSHTETIVQYVGECFEVCGNTENFDIDLDTFYIGKVDGTPLTSADCSYEGKKYIFLKSTTNANAYSPSVEYIYNLRDLDNGGAVVGTYKVIACLAVYDDATKQYKMIPELLNLGEVAAWSCGYSITMENFYMSWTNNFKRGCGENPKMMCLSTNEDDEIIYPLYASIKTTDLLCFGSSSGTLTVTASGGKMPYSYSLNGGAFVPSNVFDNLDGGIYTVTVKDADGQIYEAQPKEINEPTYPLQIEKPVVNNPVTCFGGKDGSATVKVSGGSPFATGDAYIYVWSNGQTTPTVSGLAAGNYSVTIIDANGCELTETIVIEEPPFVPANAGEDIVLPCGTNYTTIGAHIPEGISGKWAVVNGPAGWEIENPSIPVTTFIGKIGTYTLRWTVSCGATDDLKISIGDCNTIDFDGVNDHIDFGNSFNLSGEFSIETWIKPKSVTGVRTVLSKRNGADYDTSGYDLVLNNGFPEFRWNGGTITSPTAIGLDRWYHLNITSNGSGTKLYIDGVEMAAGNAANPVQNDTPFIVGALYDGSQIFGSIKNFHGWIEEVRIWNTALSQDQLRFMMNQRLTDNGGLVKGKEIPFNVPGDLSWSDLEGYYHMEIIQSGYTLGQTITSVKGKLRNITTLQQRSAPLPYISKRDGNWNDISTVTTPWLYGQGIWNAPNSKGVNNEYIDWNIVRTSHNIKSGQQDITLLGLLSDKGRLNITNATKVQNEYNPGHSLRITHYLALNGVVDLVGESQLLQDEGSILEETSSGYIERDQQGTASSYNYNYWSSPVSPIGSRNNSTYTVETVLRDGTDASNPEPLAFNYQYYFADGNSTNPKRISTYWLNVYTNKQSNTYSQWYNIKEKGGISPGEGYSMKGTSGTALITEKQNYVFVGKPHNGEINLEVDAGNDYLIGNPYPSAIDGYQFIHDNIMENGGNNTQNVFNGTLYFWDHFSGKTHYLQEYIGGYATLNLSGGLEAVATDARINATGEKAEVSPERYIPVGQAFYVSTKLAPELENLASISGGEISFKNSQRYYETDDQTEDLSVFKSREKSKTKNKSADTRQKIYLHYRSPGGYHRQLLVTRDSYTSTGFDLGYDAPLIENNKEDMYWMISDVKFVIQGVPDFDSTRELPLGLRVKTEGVIKIEIDKLLNIPDGFNIYLKDSLTKEYHDLRAGAFEGTAIAGETENRYSIVFKKIEESENPEEETTGEGTGEGENAGEENGEEGVTEGEETGTDIEVEPSIPVEEISGNIEVSYSNRNSEILITNPKELPVIRGILYNAIGQKIMVFHHIPETSVAVIPIGSRAQGVYIFKLETENETKSVQFILE